MHSFEIVSQIHPIESNDYVFNSFYCYLLMASCLTSCLRSHLISKLSQFLWCLIPYESSCFIKTSEVFLDISRQTAWWWPRNPTQCRNNAVHACKYGLSGTVVIHSTIVVWKSSKINVNCLKKTLKSLEQMKKPFSLLT